MSELMSEKMREVALEGLGVRKAKAKELGQINNADLYAGSPMYYYCRYCGLESDCLPENWFVGKPRRVCTECQGMKNEGWIE